MTPERLAFLVANCPPFTEFTRLGPIVHVAMARFDTPTGSRYQTLTYELKMFLDDLTTLNRRLGTGPNAQPAPEPVRHYEIWSEGAIIVAGDY